MPSQLSMYQDQRNIIIQRSSVPLAEIRVDRGGEDYIIVEFLTLSRRIDAHFRNPMCGLRLSPRDDPDHWADLDIDEAEPFLECLKIYSAAIRSSSSCKEIEWCFTSRHGVSVDLRAHSETTEIIIGLHDQDYEMASADLLRLDLSFLHELFLGHVESGSGST